MEIFCLGKEGQSSGWKPGCAASPPDPTAEAESGPAVSAAAAAPRAAPRNSLRLIAFRVMRSCMNLPPVGNCDREKANCKCPLFAGIIRRRGHRQKPINPAWETHAPGKISLRTQPHCGVQFPSLADDYAQFLS